MASAYYAVHRGYTPGVYNTWGECESKVAGFAGAKYKKFTNKIEAEFFASTGMIPDKDLNYYEDWILENKELTSYDTSTELNKINQRRVERREYKQSGADTNGQSNNIINTSNSNNKYKYNNDKQPSKQPISHQPTQSQCEQPAPQHLSFNDSNNNGTVKTESLKDINEILKEVYKPYRKDVKGGYVTTYHHAHPDVMYAYTDGSFRSEDRSASYGAVCFHNGGVYVLKGRKHIKNEDDLSNESRNVVGEVIGAQYAALLAKKFKAKYLILHFDYMGIGSWLIDTQTPQTDAKVIPWRAKKPISVAYQNKMKSYEGLIYIPKKVLAHSGHVYNEIADRLATEAETGCMYKQVNYIPFNIE